MQKNVLFILFLIFLTACKNDETPKFTIDLHNGIFVTNEGPFQNGTGTITFVSDAGEVTQEVYQKVNNKVLGNVVQSMTLYQDSAFIVVNNSHKVVVVDRYSFKELAIIEGEFIQNPRYLKVVNGYAYVSNWGNPQDATDDFIAVIDLSDYSLVSKISVGEGPEKMLVDNHKLYVLLKGGFGFNDKLTIVDCETNSVITNIIVGDVPTGIVKDINGAIWILCQGNPDYAMAYAQLPETAGNLVKFENNQITLNLPFAQTSIHPKNLTINQDVLFYTINNKVYQLSIIDNLLPTNEIPQLQNNYYALKA
ncbi:MAG TPA: hypothetical protein ENK67_05550, partial [Flavobacteriia bacterium]|nr:hypothetical protein [Flavobacteriia bacterium]